MKDLLKRHPVLSLLLVISILILATVALVNLAVTDNTTGFMRDVAMFGLILIIAFAVDIILRLCHLFVSNKGFRDWFLQRQKAKIQLIKALIQRLFSPFDIRPYVNLLYGIVWDILYKHDKKLPTQRPTVESDLEIKYPVDDEIVMFSCVKETTATLTKDEIRDAETIIREFSNKELYPVDEHGNLLVTALTQNGIHITLEMCKDKGLYFEMYFRITKGKPKKGKNTANGNAPLRDDEL